MKRVAIFARKPLKTFVKISINFKVLQAYRKELEVHAFVQAITLGTSGSEKKEHFERPSQKLST